jgi:hypothetical protein
MKQKVYMDAQNVGHIDEKTISGLRIEAALDTMEKDGFETHAILPSHLITGKKNKRKTIKNQDIIEKLIREKRLSLVSNEDDEAIISAAHSYHGFILTNDRYNDHKDKEWCTPEIKKLIKSKLITFDFIEEKFTLPLSERKHLNIQENDSPTPPMTVPDFKKRATNGGISSKIPFEALPEPIQKIPELISQNSGEMTLAALGSQLKNATGCKLKDLFGNAKHATRFLGSRGYPIRHDKGNTYVKGVVA